MIDNTKKFSAFKLFYDEFIYKENSSVTYDNIERNIIEIRELVLDIRKTPKFDKDFYMKKLDRTNKRLKKQLEYIYEVNDRLFKYYDFLYKNHNLISSDKVQDMPFIISCSFYDDYRIDNKTVLELESSSVVIPKYSSLEKKNIRNDAKSYTRLEYFIKLLKESNNVNLYKKFLDRSNYILRLRPFFNESHFNYIERINPYLDEFAHLWARLEEKARNCEDYENISDIMSIAFRKKFDDWNNEIKIVICEYFDDLYNKMVNDNIVRTKINVVNDISFESYVSNCDKLIKEKDELLSEYNKNLYLTYDCDYDDSYLSQFKKVLINSYFDIRYKNRIDEKSLLDDFIDRAIELYGLAYELENQIFEKILFDASRSSLIGRGNDAKSALVAKVYELYNPLYLLTRYEESRLLFEQQLSLKDKAFKREFNSKLLDKKQEFNYHGPVPTMITIKTKIIDKRKAFIIDNCVSELCSWDMLGEYDTRNYDLNIIAKDISVEDLVNVYYRAKDRIEDYDFSFLDFSNKGLVSENYNKDATFALLQELIVKCICGCLKKKATSISEEEQMYNDICKHYLNEKVLFFESNENENGVNYLEKFKETQHNYIENSKWADLLISNNMKNLL